MADEQPQGQQQFVTKEQYDQLADQYRKDMTLASQALQGQQQPQQPQEEPLWDTSDPVQLKQQVLSSFHKVAVDTLAPVVTTLAGNQFEANMSAARNSTQMPYFGKWENEIRQLASQVPPGLLANQQTIANLYQLVASKHQNELVEEEVQRRMAKQAEETQARTNGEVEVDDEENEEEQEVQQKNEPPVLRSQPQREPMTRAPSVQQARSVRQGATTRLTREEAYMAERMGMSLKQYAQAKALGDVEI